MQVLSPGVAATCYDVGNKGGPQPTPCVSLNLANEPNWVEDLLPDEKTFGGTMAALQNGPKRFLWFFGGAQLLQTARELSVYTLLELIELQLEKQYKVYTTPPVVI